MLIEGEYSPMSRVESGFQVLKAQQVVRCDKFMQKRQMQRRDLQVYFLRNSWGAGQARPETVRLPLEGCYVIGHRGKFALVSYVNTPQAKAGKGVQRRAKA